MWCSKITGVVSPLKLFRRGLAALKAYAQWS